MGSITPTWARCATGPPCRSGNYVDTHGQSEIGFGVIRLLGFELLPRIKRINFVRLYRPAAGAPGGYPSLAPAMVGARDLLGVGADRFEHRPVALITQRSQVQILSPLPRSTRSRACSPDSVSGPLIICPPFVRGTARDGLARHGTNVVCVSAGRVGLAGGGTRGSAAGSDQARTGSPLGCYGGASSIDRPTRRRTSAVGTW
jgi:hypothetical protein